MTRALDEPDAVYGLVAQTAELAPDRSAVTFRLRPRSQVRRRLAVDGGRRGVLVQTLKEKGHPPYRDAAEGRKQARSARPAHRALHLHRQPDPRSAAGGGRPAHPLQGLLATREFEQTTLDPPLGSGPYKIGDFRQGAFVSYRRRDDYWAKDLPVNRGRFNFDELRYEYFTKRVSVTA